MSYRANLKKFARLYPKEAIWMEDIESKKLKPIVPGVKLEECDDCVVYGVGNGEVYTHLKPWLKKKRKHLLVFIEDDLGVLKALLESDVGTEMLKEKRVQLLYYNKDGDNEPIFQRLMWHGLSRKVELMKDPRYDLNEYDKFRKTVQFDEDRMKWFGREFLTYGVGYYLNFYQNLKVLPECFKGYKLMGKTKGIPAYIIGAGPSLNKNGPLLKEIGKKGLIFAGGSSLPALQEMGIDPDFASGLDPNVWQRQRLEVCKHTDFPYFFRLRVNSEALSLVHGPRLFLPGAGVYPTAAWLEERLGIEDLQLEEGHNVINFMTDLVVKMGCNPVVFVGMDLAYTESKAYAKGVIWPDPMPQDLVQTNDIYNQSIVTRWLWLKESYWLADYAKEHPTVQFINATEGGIGFKGVPNMPLQQVLQDNPQEKVTDELFHFDPLEVKEEQINALVHELKESLIRLDTLLEQMAQVYQTVDPKTFKGQIPEEAIWTLQFHEEVAYPAILSVFDEYFLQIINYTPLFYTIQRDGLKQSQASSVLKYQLERIAYLRKVIQIQLEMMSIFS